MAVDPRWRRRVEALKRAGLDYVSRERLVKAEFAAPLVVPTPPQIPTVPAPPPPLQTTVVVAPEFRPTPARSFVAPPEPVIASTQLFEAEEEPPPPPALLPGQSKEDALRIMAAEVAECTRCEVLVRERSQTVFSDGTPHAELCFVGEAPGAEEDRQGVPFVGPAGQLLTRIIEACRLRRDEVYICNVLKCRPPGNRNPEWDEMCNCRGFLERQIDIVRPKVIVGLGKFGVAFLLGQKPESVPITRIRGQWKQYRGIPVMPTYHPSYLLRNPAAKKDVWEDMKVVMRKLGRPIDAG